MSSDGTSGDEGTARSDRSYRGTTSLLVLALLFGLIACSAGPPPARRLADGRVVPEAADYEAPIPLEPIPAPPYPEWMREARMQGVFVADVVVDETGDVVRVEVVNRFDRGIAAEAVRTLEGTRFEPASLDGRPVAAIYRYRAEYRLD